MLLSQPSRYIRHIHLVHFLTMLRFVSVTLNNYVRRGKQRPFPLPSKQKAISETLEKLERNGEAKEQCL